MRHAARSSYLLGSSVGAPHCRNRPRPARGWKCLPSQTTSPPAIDTKQITTSVLVQNGGTVVIGGIYTQTESDSTTKIPVLGDIPYIGFMFRNNAKVDRKK